MVTKVPKVLEEEKENSQFREEFAKFSSNIRTSCNSFFFFLIFKKLQKMFQYFLGIKKNS